MAKPTAPVPPDIDERLESLTGAVHEMREDIAVMMEMLRRSEAHLSHLEMVVQMLGSHLRRSLSQ